MEIQLLEKSKDGMKVNLLIRGVSDYFVNTLRRAIIEEVPTMAIEDIDLRKNSSVLYDEIVGHRLGLVPLKTDLKSYNLPSECKCKGEGCARCKVTLSLKSKKAGYVYAEEMESNDKNIVPVFDKMPIAKLNKGQNLEFEAVAVLGKGKVHSKWAPAHVYYYNEAKITVNNDDKLLSQFRHLYPPQIFESNGKVDRNLINTPALIDACDGISKLIEIEKKEDSYIFVIESWGQLTPKEILNEAISQIDKQLDEITVLMKE